MLSESHDHYAECGMPNPARFEYRTSRMAGTPIWECRDCHQLFTYVECACDVEHDCGQQCAECGDFFSNEPYWREDEEFVGDDVYCSRTCAQVAYGRAHNLR